MTAADLILRARTLIELRRFDAVLGLLNGSELVADNADGLTLLAQAHLGLAQDELACTAARGAIRADPEMVAAYRLLSTGLLRCGDFVGALDAAELAVRLDPHDWRSFVQIVDVGVTQRRVTDRTRVAAETALALAPHSPATHLAAGNVELADGRRRQARDAYRAALRLDPQYAIARNNLAAAAGRAIWLPRGSQFIHLFAALRLDPSSVLYARNVRRVSLVVFLQINLVVGFAALFAVGSTAPTTSTRQSVAVFTGGQTSAGPSANASRVVVPGSLVTATTGTVYVVTPHSTTRRPTGHPGGLLAAAIIAAVLIGSVAGGVWRAGRATAVRLVWSTGSTVWPRWTLPILTAAGLVVLASAALIGQPQAYPLASAAVFVGLATTVLLAITLARTGRTTRSQVRRPSSPS